MRLLGIDLGGRRIGLALADSESGKVRPLATIRRSDPGREALTLARLLDEQRVDEIVVGLPLNMDGTEGDQADETRAWAAAIAAAVACPVTLRDERLTSIRAEGEAGRLRRGRSGGPPSAAARAGYRARIDRLAAADIVQRELDARMARARADDAT